jgi:LysR family transcriptional regulator, low CO2-responsive transcriptional regulator
MQSKIRRYLKHGTLPQLRVFEAVARLGNFTHASRELHIAQPTASVQVRKLSETVGLPLFEHVSKSIYLTDAGERVLACCSDVFRALSQLEETLGQMRGLASGRLQLAVTSAARYFAPRLLGAFIQRYPGIDASLQVHNRSTLIGRLGGNEDDLYMFGEPPAEHEVVVQAILPNPLVVVARSDHPLAHEKSIAFARLAVEPFLLREAGSETRMVALKLFKQHGLAPKVRMELSTNEAVREAVLAGIGVSILPRYALGREPEESALFCLDVEGFPVESHWHFVYPTGKRLSEAARAFMDFARAEARRLALDGFDRPPG